VTWPGVAALAVVCVAMRVAVPLGLGDRRPPWLERGLSSAVPGLLAALVVTGAFARGQHLEADPRQVGLAAALVVIALRGPMPLVVVVAAGVTGALRLLL
jgi:branched-subunit amino acid transport protein